MFSSSQPHFVSFSLQPLSTFNYHLFTSFELLQSLPLLLRVLNTRSEGVGLLPPHRRLFPLSPVRGLAPVFSTSLANGFCSGCLFSNDFVLHEQTQGDSPAFELAVHVRLSVTAGLQSNSWVSYGLGGAHFFAFVRTYMTLTLPLACLHSSCALSLHDLLSYLLIRQPSLWITSSSPPWCDCLPKCARCCLYIEPDQVLTRTLCWQPTCSSSSRPICTLSTLSFVFKFVSKLSVLQSGPSKTKAIASTGARCFVLPPAIWKAY